MLAVGGEAGELGPRQRDGVMCLRPVTGHGHEARPVVPRGLAADVDLVAHAGRFGSGWHAGHQ